MTGNTSLVFPFLLTCFLVFSCETEEAAVIQQEERELPEPALSGEKTELSGASKKSAYEKAIILEGAASHQVIWGDTLTTVAARYYGSGNGCYFPLIMLASQSVVWDPDKIIPGGILTVPDLRRNLDNPDSRQTLKGYINEVANIYAAKPPTKWSDFIRDRLRALASTL